ncbi:kinase-like domain, phloem protein 2-like protein [Tanacetum coccineum]
MLKIHSSPNHIAHLRIPLEDIESATNYFDEENVIEESGFGKIYKGQLSWSGESINIIARRLIDKEWDEKEQQFWTEISMLSSLKHKNVVSIVGFCNEVGAETIIYKLDFRGKLENCLSDMTLLTWVKRLEICIGVAHALCYIHYDEPRDFSIIHRNVSSETVVLNNDWEPKLSEFQHSMKIKACDRHHFLPTDLVWSKKGYTDPTCLETNIVTHKSDIYSFGIVLFELLCARKSVSDDQDNKYLAPVAIYHYRENELDGIIDPDLWKQMDPRSFNIFAETAYNCLNEERSQRPNIYEIVTRLEKALALELERENVVHLVAAAEVEGISSNHEKSPTYLRAVNPKPAKRQSFLKDVSHLKLSYQKLESATDNFAKENILNENRLIIKGRLLRSEQYIDIFVKGYNSDSEEDDSKRLRVELSMLSSLKHKNLVSLIGFLDEAWVDRKAIVYKRVANGSLKQNLLNRTLTWMQRLKICTDVANALSYIHYDVGLARRRRLLLTRDIIENAYLDPKYKKTGGVTHKSDVYSFGVVLLEVLFGRSAIDEDEDEDKDSDEEDDDMVMPHLRKQMDPESFKIFSETAYWCIKQDRADRPYIDEVVKRLEKALEFQWKHENPVNLTSSNQFEVKFPHEDKCDERVLRGRASLWNMIA